MSLPLDLPPERTPSLVVRIPVPPSANNLYANRPGGRFVTTVYKQWRVAGGLIVRAAIARLPTWTPQRSWRYSVSLDVPIDHRRDLDNAIKPTLDLLQEAGAIHDDRYVERVAAERITPRRDRQKMFVAVTRI